MKKRITIQDLAKELNTTPSTVSRALNNHPNISDDMKKRVNKLAEKWNYQVNSIASNLRKGKSKSIGVIVPRINRDFFSHVIAGIENVAYEYGYSVVICQTHDQIDKEKEYIKTLISSGVDGILVSIGLETKEYEHFEKVSKLGIPLVFFDRVVDEIETIKIMNNDYDGAYEAVMHLIDMGYKRIAHYSGPLHLNIYKKRHQGYKDALIQCGIKYDKNLVIESNMKKEIGYRDMETLMESKNPPDALFSASDYAALGAMEYLRDHKIKVPEEVGIVGFSNENFTSLVTPQMTTIDQHASEIGRYSAKLFFEEIEKPSIELIARTITLKPTLIVRGSTKKKKA